MHFFFITYHSCYLQLQLRIENGDAPGGVEDILMELTLPQVGSITLASQPRSLLLIMSCFALPCFCYETLTLYPFLSSMPQFYDFVAQMQTASKECKLAVQQ
jgi:hypothetical protein